MSLGRWAVLDIETTGINPANDEIIDIGYLQFDGCKLVRTFSSLVKADHNVSSFITKLTGITNKSLAQAPLWSQVENDLLDLEGHQLIAHNSSFEESFLSRYFEKYRDDYYDFESGSDSEAEYREQKVVFYDSILFLGLLFPQFQYLNLEHFLNQLQLSEKEQHRGLADSKDLLKVLLLAVALFYDPELSQSFPYDQEARLKLIEVFQTFPEDYFFKNFFLLSQQELLTIAEHIDFNLSEAIHIYKSKIKKTNTKNHQVFVPSENDNDESNDTQTFQDFSSDLTKENIQKIFQNESFIQTKIPHYKYRSTQEALSIRLGQSLKNNLHALIQAPTGTGKTMGYLLPSVLFALNEKKTCLVATGTKVLQEQAIEKDVPQIQKIFSLDDDFRFVKLVGSSNHFCELLYRENDEMSLIQSFDEIWTKAYFEILFYYNSKVAYHQKITREDVPFVLKKKIEAFREQESHLAVDYRACPGGHCPLSKNCSYFQGLQEAKKANLIIGNHAMMLNWPKSLDRPSYIIVDEAHKLEHEATKAYSLEVSHQSLNQFSKNFPQGMGSLLYLLSSSEDSTISEEKKQNLIQQTKTQLQILEDHLRALPALMESWFKKSPRYNPAYFNELLYPNKDHLKDQLSVDLLNKFDSLRFIFETLFDLYAPYFNQLEFKKYLDDPQKTKALTVFENHFSILEKMHESFNHFSEAHHDWCTFIKYHEQDGYYLVSSPINVGKKIHEELLQASSSVTFTSATLGNSSGDLGVQGIEWMTGYCYLPPEKRFKKGLFLEAIFDYKKQAKVFLSSDTRNLSDPLFVSDLMKEVFPLVKELKGKTLFLFSSKVRFQAAVEMILSHFDQEIPVFVQGMGKNVIDDFKKEKNAILIGMESFAEGIDIPGEKLSFIVIDKIPDVRQDLVIQKRRDFFEASFGNEFNDYFLAHRTRSLHQKFGRLIRTETDHGAILIVDNRVKRWKGKTLQNFRQMMQPYDVTMLPLRETCEEIKSYFVKT